MLLLATFDLYGQSYGLTSRTSVAAFLNNKLPRSAPTTVGQWTTVSAFPNIGPRDPTALVPAPRSNRLYVGGRQGIIWFFDNNPTATNLTVFLDLQAATQGWADCGLLGIAFHPDFGLQGATNRGYFYVWRNYTTTPTDNPALEKPTFGRLSRFRVPDNSLVADPSSELVLINQYDRHVMHNGGGMFFGEDGFLYFTVGDEGGADDLYNTGQKINGGFFGGVFRIDVNKNAATSHPIARQPLSGGTNSPASSSGNYYIPNDNPFTGSVLQEFFALGVRSPHRMTYDSLTKRIWLSDTGEFSREEINIIKKGGNYQWPYREGTLVGRKPKPAVVLGTESGPIHNYGRTNLDACVIGGYVYRGSALPDLYGKYIFGDNRSGRIWAMTYDGTNAPVVEYLCSLPSGHVGYTGLSSFGVDQNNELFLCRMGRPGEILKLKRATTVNPAPALLSQTGAFTNLAAMTAADGLIPYTVNSPLWSDGSEKKRWIAVPNDGSPYTTNEQISFSPTGEWSFPTGTVFVKTFTILTNETNLSSVKKLETRILVRGTNDAFYGLTYKWRSNGAEADLLEGSYNETFTVQTTSGTRTQVWYYPSRQDCLTCHNGNAKFVLGVKTRQLNGNFTYPPTGTTDNQLRSWNHVQLFTPALSEPGISNYARLVAVTNTTASLLERVRSYIDSNCAGCHRPGGTPAFFDARYDTSIESQAIIYGALYNTFGNTNSKVVVPGKITTSMMRLRMNALDSSKMPPLAKNRIDTNALATLDAWILSLTNAPRLSTGKDLSGDYLSCNGEQGMTYALQGTTNFPSWSPIGTVTNATRRYINNDMNSHPRRFYRLSIP